MDCRPEYGIQNNISLGKQFHDFKVVKNIKKNWDIPTLVVKKIYLNRMLLKIKFWLLKDNGKSIKTKPLDQNKMLIITEHNLFTFIKETDLVEEGK